MMEERPLSDGPADHLAGNAGTSAQKVAPVWGSHAALADSGWMAIRDQRRVSWLPADPRLA